MAHPAPPSVIERVRAALAGERGITEKAMFGGICFLHRGNMLCKDGSGNTGARFLCPYHLWSYDLEGALKGVARPDLVGPIDKGELGLLEVPVDTFAGFVFLNPDPDAGPLADFLGDEVRELMAPYHLDQMVTVLDVRESIDCNWKVVMDAFQEGYFIIDSFEALLEDMLSHDFDALYPEVADQPDLYIAR